MINVLEPASLVNGLNKSNALPALVAKSLGITTETYTHVAIRQVKTSARRIHGLKSLDPDRSLCTYENVGTLIWRVGSR
jgi:hypothetical protein